MGQLQICNHYEGVPFEIRKRLTELHSLLYEEDRIRIEYFGGKIDQNLKIKKVTITQ